MMIEQRTPEWYEFRKNRIGASDAPVIMRKSPWKTPYQLWQEKLSLVEEKPGNVATERGNEMEPIAKRALEDKLGMPLQPLIKLHNQRSWMMASLDAVSFDESIVAEIKCPGNADHSIALSGQVPEKYFPQLQHQLEVCGLDWMYYFSYAEDAEILIKVHRDEEYIKQLLIEEEKFLDCMLNFEAPELTAEDYVWQDGAHWAKLVARLQEIKLIKAEEEGIKQELIALTNGKNSRGAGIQLTKCMRKGAVDYKSIPELIGVDLEGYRKKPTEYWRFS